MKTIFDIGMFDALDTRYYLEEGFEVIAVEANPYLVRRSEIVLREFIASGQLKLVHAAVVNDSRDLVELIISDDLGASSIHEEKIVAREEIGSFKMSSVTVPTVKLEDLFDKFGTPYYLKVDIEGADRECILTLSLNRRPTYVSFEVGHDVEELIAHLAAIGYSSYKMINQCNFRELSNQRNLYDRTARRIINLLGYSQPQYVRFKGGRFFKYMYSSGPAPWFSDGNWFSVKDILMKWRSAIEHGRIGGDWYDVHTKYTKDFH